MYDVFLPGSTSSLDDDDGGGGDGAGGGGAGAGAGAGVISRLCFIIALSKKARAVSCTPKH